MQVLALVGQEKRQWQRQCAMIFQQFNLVPRMDVCSNVLHGILNGRSLAATLFNQYANMAFIRLATQEVPDRPAHASHMRGVLQLLCHGMLEL